MLWQKSFVIVFLQISFLLNVNYLVSAAGSDLLAADETLIDQTAADVTGDGTIDQILLYGKVQGNGGGFSNINVLVQDGANPESVYKTALSGVTGESGRIFVCDLTGDAVNDVLFAVNDSRTGIRCFGSEFKNHQAQILFTSEEKSVKSGELILTGDNNGQTLNVRSGTKIQLRLNENPSTGYVWQWNGFDQNHLQLLDQQMLVPDNSAAMVGRPGLRVFTLLAQNPGDITIDLANFPMWKTQAEAADNFKVTIHII